MSFNDKQPTEMDLARQKENGQTARLWPRDFRQGLNVIL
jgi:hypothetical protein